MLNASRAVAGHRRRDHVRGLARAALQRVPGRRRSAPRRFAAYGATIGAAFAIGPLVGGALTSGLDWRWIFLVNLPLGLICLRDHAPLRRGVARTPTRRALDSPGQLTLTAGLFLLVLALLRGNEDGWTSAPIVAALAGAVAFLARVHRRRGARQGADAPAAACSATAPSPARRSAAFAISASFFAVFLYTTLYLQQILGLSAIEAGLVYLPGTLIMLVVSGATANLVEKVGAARADRRRARARRHRPGAADARRGRLVVGGLPPRRDRRLHRHRALQPGRSAPSRSARRRRR